MEDRFTRRRLAAALVMPAAARSADAQQSAPPVSGDADLQAARERLQRSKAALQAAPLPVATEPAFHFKA